MDKFEKRRLKEAASLLHVWDNVINIYPNILGNFIKENTEIKRIVW